MAGWTRLEPAASGVTGRRYNQLNYHPISLGKHRLLGNSFPQEVKHGKEPFPADADEHPGSLLHHGNGRRDGQSRQNILRLLLSRWQAAFREVVEIICREMENCFS